MSLPTLYADYGCPYAHRVLALLHELDVEAEIRTARIGEKPEGLERYSATGRLPLLEHEGLVLTESRVILEYLAERFDYAAGHPSSLHARTQQRHAIALVDEYLTPALWKPTRPQDGARLEEGLAVFEAAMSHGPQPSLFALHIAPIWLRLAWYKPDEHAVQAVSGRAALREWLDGLIERPSIQATSPDHARVREQIERARAEGLIKPTLGVVAS